MLSQLKSDLQKLADKKRAIHNLRFFKTGKGEYGEGDKFLGLTLPQMHTVVKKYKDLPLGEIEKLLQSEIHEHRLIALMLLARQYKNNKKQVFDLYLKNTKNINNWDLVDISAPKIVGDYLLDKNRSILFKLVGSNLLWDRRIAILATLAFIKNNDLKDALKIYQMLLNDREDLIHKAVGWMLREAGKRDQGLLENFLDKYASRMPRTMLRYAIEKFPEGKRNWYLQKK